MKNLTFREMLSESKKKLRKKGNKKIKAKIFKRKKIEFKAIKPKAAILLAKKGRK